jgi:hypothetical protein
MVTFSPTLSDASGGGISDSWHSVNMGEQASLPDLLLKVARLRGQAGMDW